jgi:hypothetical protein
MGDRRQRRPEPRADRAGNMLGDGKLQPFLATEVVDDRRKVGAGRSGNIARACALVAKAAERFQPGLDKLRPCIRPAVALCAAIGGGARFSRRLLRRTGLLPGSTGQGKLSCREESKALCSRTN